MNSRWQFQWRMDPTQQLGISVDLAIGRALPEVFASSPLVNKFLANRREGGPSTIRLFDACRSTLVPPASFEAAFTMWPLHCSAVMQEAPPHGTMRRIGQRPPR